MAIKTLCDRSGCGDVVEAGKGGAKLELQAPGVERYDLCPKCLKKFRGWLAAPENKEEVKPLNTITYEQRAEIYVQAADTFGRDTQAIVAIEELSELTKELCKVLRLDGRLGCLAEEIADATIMLEQLRTLYDVNELVCAFMDSKVKRLAERIEEARHD